MEDQMEAGRLMRSHDLGYTDLLTLRTMRRLGIEEIYSSDKGFDRISDVRRIFSELRDEEGYQDFYNMLKHINESR